MRGWGWGRVGRGGRESGRVMREELRGEEGVGGDPPHEMVRASSECR